LVNADTGTVAQRMRYDEFGVVLEDTNPGFQPFGYAGGFYDADTGLVRFGARDYDSATGRWLAKDPIGFNGEQLNLFIYVDAEPVNQIDSSGLVPTDNLYGFGKPFWNWFHAQGLEGLKGPNGQVPKPVAQPYFDDWKRNGKPGPDSKGMRDPRGKGFKGPDGQRGYIRPPLILPVMVLIGGLIYPNSFGCAELDCDHDGIRDFTDDEPMIPEDPCDHGG